jgi:hypothetical protein
MVRLSARVVRHLYGPARARERATPLTWDALDQPPTHSVKRVNVVTRVMKMRRCYRARQDRRRVTQDVALAAMPPASSEKEKTGVDSQ